METRREDIITIDNLAPTHVKTFDKFIMDVAVMIKAEFKLRGIYQSKIHLLRQMGEEELKEGKVDLVVKIERAWPNETWQDFAIRLNKALQYKFRGTSLSVSRINFKYS